VGRLQVGPRLAPGAVQRYLRRFPAEPGWGPCYAMNMRAADAIVSRAPKPMKIFPIMEV